jgi:hypothetical protein
MLTQKCNCHSIINAPSLLRGAPPSTTSSL